MCRSPWPWKLSLRTQVGPQSGRDATSRVFTVVEMDGLEEEGGAERGPGAGEGGKCRRRYEAGPREMKLEGWWEVERSGVVMPVLVEDMFCFVLCCICNVCIVTKRMLEDSGGLDSSSFNKGGTASPCIVGFKYNPVLPVPLATQKNSLR